MRQRKIKYVSKKLLDDLGIITYFKELKVSENTYLELGSGKGKFITDLANYYKDNNYIAVEKSMDASYRIYEKKLDLNLSNLTIVNLDVKDLQEFIKSKTISGIYLNFSDPWPKKKHHKRRLTNPNFLKTYNDLLKDQGFIQFRTDHKDFFLESLIDLEENFETIKIDYDLKPSEFMTEYEIKKRDNGPIYEYLGVKKC